MWSAPSTEPVDGFELVEGAVETEGEQASVGVGRSRSTVDPVGVGVTAPTWKKRKLDRSETPSTGAALSPYA